MEEPSDEPERYTRKKSRPAPKKISSAKSPINIVDLYDGQRNTALPEEESMTLIERKVIISTKDMTTLNISIKSSVIRQKGES